MRVLPILFNTEMVRAILDGRKSCTRRIIKLQPQSRLCYTFAGSDCGTWGYPSKSAHEIWGDEYRLPEDITDEELKRRWRAPYHTRDILYVRETWHKYTKRIGKGEGCHFAEFYGYKASVANSEDANEPWKPSIHMPKEAARIWLKVTDVKVERLQDITSKEAKNEGVGNLFYDAIGYSDKDYGTEVDPEYGITREQFAWLWESTIKKSDLDRYGWQANPWVWVIEFERCEKPEVN